MKQRTLISTLLTACLVLGGISVVIYMGQDRKAPEISVDKTKVTYHDGESYEVLLKGVTAKDNRDGELTEEIFVDKIIPTKKGKAVVYYGVLDKAGNVGTATRTITYQNGDVNGEEVMPPEEETTAEPQNTEPEKPEDPNELIPTTEAPVIALTADHATIAAGSGFDPLSVVKGVADTKDNADELSRRISAEGVYDVNVPGTYQIEYFVMDTDGNASERKVFTLTVE